MSVRLGIFTGRLYTIGDETHGNIEECTILLSDKASQNEELMFRLNVRNKQRCNGCHGCPEAKKSYGKVVNR